MNVRPQTVLLTRPADESRRLARRLRQAGHSVFIAPMSAPEELTPPLPEGCDALVITSARAMQALNRHPDAHRLVGLPVFAIGAASARAAHKAGWPVAGHASGVRAALVERVAAKARKPLYLAGEPASGDLVAELALQGVAAQKAVLYRMRPTERLPSSARLALEAGHVDLVLLMSARTAQLFNEAAAKIDRNRISIACLSQAVADAAGKGWRQIIVAGQPDLSKLLAAAGLLCENDANRQQHSGNGEDG